jgi:AraC-like DNA-binding protein
MKINLKASSERLKRNDRHTLLALRFAVTYSIFLFIILLLMLYLHRASTRRATEEFWDQNESTFQSAVSLVDSDFSMMESFCRQLLQNSSFFRLSNMSTTEHSDFYLSGMSMKTSLATYMYSYRELPLNTCFIYLRNTNYVISVNTFNTESLYYARNYTGDSAKSSFSTWQEYLFAENGSGTMYSLSGFVPDSSDNSYLYLIDMNALSYKNVPATAAFHISNEKLNHIFSGIPLENGGAVIVADENGKPVFCIHGDSVDVNSETDSSCEELVNSLSLLSYYNNDATVVIDNTSMHVTRTLSVNDSNWTFYLIQPESLYSADYQWVFYLLFFSAAVLGLFLITLLARNNVQPIIQLDDQLQETITDRNQLKMEVEAVQPIVYDNYLRQLMTGSITSSDELRFIQNYLHLDSPNLHYYVMYGMTYENDLVERTDSVTDKSVDLNELITQCLAGYFSYEKHLFLYSPKKRVYALLLPFTGDSEQMLISLQEKVLSFHEMLLNEHSIWFFTGIGLPCTFSNIWESYQQAKDASSYTNKSYIFLPYEMLKKDSHVYYYPAEFSSKLVRFITNGSKTQVMEIFSLIHQENIEERALPVQLLRFLLTDIRNTLLRARFAYTENDASKAALIAEIDDLLSSDDLSFRLCEDIGLKLCELFSTKSEKNNLIDTIVSYIHTNYKDPALCLSKISDEFHISESYFSHTFKENMNINFSVYLEDLRLTEAARLIKEGNSGLNEIGLEVGYNNQTSFRRAFKKKFGVSPSNYV